MNIIGDVAGQYEALLKLISLMPKDEPVVLLGDLNDRGPQSRDVIEYAMSQSNVRTLNSNHGDMFVDFMLSITDADYEQRYHPYDFTNNGGWETLASYGYTTGMNRTELAQLVPASHIQWLKSRPFLIKETGVLLTHAPIPEGFSIEEALRIPGEVENSVLWNRGVPEERDGFTQIFGHNSHWGIKWLSDYAVCIDTSRNQILTGIHWPSKRIYQVAY